MIHINIKNPAPKDNLSILPKWKNIIKTEKRFQTILGLKIFSDGGIKFFLKKAIPMGLYGFIRSI